MESKHTRPGTHVEELQRTLNDHSSVAETNIFGRATGSTAASLWNVLSQTLEAAVNGDKPRTHCSAPPPVYRSHLDIRQKALDDMFRIGFPPFMSFGIYNRLGLDQFSVTKTRRRPYPVTKIGPCSSFTTQPPFCFCRLPSPCSTEYSSPRRLVLEHAIQPLSLFLVLVHRAITLLLSSHHHET